MSPSAATTPDWMGAVETAPRGRVLRDHGAAVAVVDLPRLDDLEEPSAALVPSDSDNDGHQGAAAVAVAIAYRSGFESGRREGFAVGHADGLRTGHDEATADAVRRYDQVLAELRTSAGEHLAALDALTAQVSAELAELAFAVAESVLGRELALAADPGADAVRRAIAAIGGPADATARLHPDDLQQMSVSADELAPGAALRLVADPGVDRGGCVLESGATTVDASIDAALHRVRAALGLEGSAT